MLDMGSIDHSPLVSLRAFTAPHYGNDFVGLFCLPLCWAERAVESRGWMTHTPLQPRAAVLRAALCILKVHGPYKGRRLGAVNGTVKPP